jgi:hypothetical protein
MSTMLANACDLFRKSTTLNLGKVLRRWSEALVVYGAGFSGDA